MPGKGQHSFFGAELFAYERPMDEALPPKNRQIKKQKIVTGGATPTQGTKFAGLRCWVFFTLTFLWKLTSQNMSRKQTQVHMFFETHTTKNVAPNPLATLDEHALLLTYP